MTDDPRGYHVGDLADPRKLRSYIVAECEDSAAWRDERAEAYPDDYRNQASAVALRVASRDIAALSDDDPRLDYMARFFALIETFDEAEDILAEHLERQDRLIGRHGFGKAAPTRTTDELLAELVSSAVPEGGAS
jgi:hypothetical protein